jgi:hypothetical protein
VGAVVQCGVVDVSMHLANELLDVLRAKAADAGRELHRVDQARLLPAAERVLVDAETSSCFAYPE